MIVGICRLEFLIYESNSLKEKRFVLKSIIDRVRHRYNVSIAEVDKQDVWNVGVIGFAAIGNETQFINGTISRVIDFIDGDHRVEIVSEDIEII